MKLFDETIDELSPEQWVFWNQSVFSSAFGWIPAEMRDLSGETYPESYRHVPIPDVVRKYMSFGYDVLYILSFGQLKTELPCDDGMSSYYIEQVDMLRALASIWISYTDKDGEYLPDINDSPASYVKRVWNVAYDKGIDHAVSAFIAGVPLHDVVSDVDIDQISVYDMWCTPWRFHLRGANV